MLHRLHDLVNQCDAVRFEEVLARWMGKPGKRSSTALPALAECTNMMTQLSKEQNILLRRAKVAACGQGSEEPQMLLVEKHSQASQPRPASLHAALKPALCQKISRAPGNLLSDASGARSILEHPDVVGSHVAGP